VIRLLTIFTELVFTFGFFISMYMDLAKKAKLKFLPLLYYSVLSAGVGIQLLIGAVIVF
jgi:hypothetical protein